MSLYIGLISGTSMDAVDAALVDCVDDGRLLLREYQESPYPEPLAAALHAARAEAEALPLGRLYTLDIEVGRVFANAALSLIRQAGVDAREIAAIGSHGQTLCHYPDGDWPYTVQIGDPNIIAATTRIATVADLRRMDIALGGQGAPLASALHASVFAHAGRHRAIVNIGGIANVTLLPAGGDGLSGFDTGPGNGLLDDWAHRHLGAAYDEGGNWARSGQLSAPLLEALLADGYFSRPPPKSTGREYFSLAWLQDRLTRLVTQPAAADVQATLLTLTVHTIAQAILDFAPRTQEIYVCGGGVRNTALLQDLGKTLQPRLVATTDVMGIPPHAVEAILLAWLAKRRLEMKAGNLPAVTGARSPAILGGVYLPPL